MFRRIGTHTLSLIQYLLVVAVFTTLGALCWLLLSGLWIMNSHVMKLS